MTEFLIGISLGLVFFGGLYWTVQKLADVKHPSLLMTVSLLFRMTVLLAVLFYVSKGGYQGVLFTLAGMLLVRVVMTFNVKRPNGKSNKGGE
ncbi:MAG TPA: ATP synthase subunit I [Clostridiales bacterium]|jgi:F1F0 ATPase subunit 2|nr:ATP synthase subunit I [Clostridiales bacterium]